MSHASQGQQPARERILSGTPPLLLAGMAATILLAVALVTYGWVGLTDSDDLGYAAAARGWVEHFPYVAGSHWGLRHAIVLPMALLFRLFGENEATLATPLVAYLVALLLLTFLCVRRVANAAAGLLAAALIVTVPLISSGVSIVTTDIPEIFFDLASLWAFHFAAQQPRRWLFLLCGVLAGLGFLTRETSVALLLLYGLAFLAGFGEMKRLNYIWMGVGFAAVFGLDTAYLCWGSGGDPLWRFHVSQQGVARDNPSIVGLYKSNTSGFDSFGSLIAPRWLQPFLVTFVNQNFGPYFWLAVPGAIAALRVTTGQQRRVSELFDGYALIWFLLTGYVLLSLWVLARYELMVAAAMAAPLALTLAWLARRGHQLVVAGAMAVLVLSNLVLVGAANRHPLFGERALVAFVRREATDRRPMLTDPSTLAGARWLLEVNGLGNRVEAAPPRPGAYYVFDSNPRRDLPADWPVQRPAPDWEQIAVVRDSPRWPALVVRRLGLNGVLPMGLRQKLDPAPRWAALYRIPPAAPGGDGSGGERGFVDPSAEVQ